MAQMVDAREGAKILGQSAGVRRLEDTVLLDVSGDDTRSWLNGQLTNDVRHTGKGDAVYALAVTVKGKIMADVWAFDRGDDRFWLAVPAASVDALLESFDHQIIMEDVEVERDASVRLVTVVGPKSAAVVEGLGDDVWVFATERLGESRDVIVKADDADVVSRLVERAGDVGGGEVDEAAWELARLRRHTPRYGADFDGRNYPQEAGLKARALSFQKGCYLGQEVVCMLENRGKLSKRLVALRLPADTPREPETKIDVDGQPIGRITSSVADGDEAVALGYVKTAYARAGTHVKVGDGDAEVTALVD